MASKKRQNKKQRHNLKRKQRKKQLKQLAHVRQGKKQVPKQAIPQNALASTTTGEYFQPVRLHYTVPDIDLLFTYFEKLECMAYDSGQKRWVWHYSDEAAHLEFEQTPNIDKDASIVLGEFFSVGWQEMILNVNSHKRTIYALEFFDQHIPREVAEVTDLTVINRLFSMNEVVMAGSLTAIFNKHELTVVDSEAFLAEFEAISNQYSDDEEAKKLALLQHMSAIERRKLPDMEKVRAHFYEDGINSIRTQLVFRKLVASKQWLGETDYTMADAITEVVEQMDPLDWDDE